MSRIAKPKPDAVVYPSSDGKRMAENTLQYEWIVTIKGNLDILCVGERSAFVAGDNLIYPVKGDPTICTAPDVYVAFGRPGGHRPSYKVWEEGNIFPQVVFEILSPSNTAAEMDLKRQFYQRYGAEEYYVYDPNIVTLEGWQRNKRRLVAVTDIDGYVSPRLGIQFHLNVLTLKITGPDGQPFLTFGELHKRAEQERKRAEQEHKRANEAMQQLERLREKMRTLGIDPDQG